MVESTGYKEGKRHVNNGGSNERLIGDVSVLPDAQNDTENV
jgi:hypothetical protein